MAPTPSQWLQRLPSSHTQQNAVKGGSWGGVVPRAGLNTTGRGRRGGPSPPRRARAGAPQTSDDMTTGSLRSRRCQGGAPRWSCGPAGRAPGCGQARARPFRAESQHLQRFHGLLPESPGQNLALTVVYAPYSLDSGLVRQAHCSPETFSDIPRVKHSRYETLGQLGQDGPASG